MSNLETQDKDEIVCPYCGYEHQDFWDIGADTGCDCNITCGSCNKEFIVSTKTYSKYSTNKINCEDKCPIEEHDYQLAERGYSGIRIENPYIYNNKNWTVYRCTKCDDEEIKTGPVAEDGKPYIIPIDQNKT